jgi:hypothetical protein
MLLFLLGFIILCYVHRLGFVEFWYAWVYKPEDYSKPLVAIDFDVSKPQKYVFEFKHKYTGNYAIYLRIAKNSLGLGQRLKTKYRLRLKFISDKTYEIELDEHSSPGIFYGVISVGNYYLGVDIFKYKVPEYLPVNKDIKLEIEVIKPDNEFEHLYGKQKLYIGKGSDK